MNSFNSQQLAITLRNHLRKFTANLDSINPDLRQLLKQDNPDYFSLLAACFKPYDATNQLLFFTMGFGVANNDSPYYDPILKQYPHLGVVLHFKQFYAYNAAIPYSAPTSFTDENIAAWVSLYLRPLCDEKQVNQALYLTFKSNFGAPQRALENILTSIGYIQKIPNLFDNAIPRKILLLDPIERELYHSLIRLSKNISPSLFSSEKVYCLQSILKALQFLPKETIALGKIATLLHEIALLENYPINHPIKPTDFTKLLEAATDLDNYLIEKSTYTHADEINDYAHLDRLDNITSWLCIMAGLAIIGALVSTSVLTVFVPLIITFFLCLFAIKAVGCQWDELAQAIPTRVYSPPVKSSTEDMILNANCFFTSNKPSQELTSDFQAIFTQGCNQ